MLERYRALGFGRLDDLLDLAVDVLYFYCDLVFSTYATGHSQALLTLPFKMWSKVNTGSSHALLTFYERYKLPVASVSHARR